MGRYQVAKIYHPLLLEQGGAGVYLHGNAPASIIYYAPPAGYAGLSPGNALFRLSTSDPIRAVNSCGLLSLYFRFTDGLLLIYQKYGNATRLLPERYAIGQAYLTRRA